MLLQYRYTTHFDISIQHIAGRNLKFTDYHSGNPVGKAMPEENYGEEYVINILTEQAELNLKYGTLLAIQSESSKTIIATEMVHSKNKMRNTTTNHIQIECSRRNTA